MSCTIFCALVRLPIWDSSRNSWFTIHGQQLKHKNGRRVGYCADFQYRQGNKLVVEEVKGFAARDWPLRAAVFRALHPEIELREV